MKSLNIPVGVSDFTEIRQNGYYYIDKSGLIKDILETTSTKVTLITRPRRFGKTLAMSMLDAFFDIRKESKKLFDGLEISKQQDLIAKESIFTGMNNFVSDTITASRLNEYFGFVQKEVNQILYDAAAEAYADTIKEWYDGYHFGDYDIYCPWDVMNYILVLQYNPKARPESYWKNTSDNAIIRSFIDYAGSNITKKLEILMSGGYIVQHIDEYLTYDYLHSDEDNLWSILYLTGYLTRVRESDGEDHLSERGMTALIIPNKEIKEIFETTVIKWFDESARTWNRKALFDAVWSGDSEGVTNEMNRLLRRTISYHDYREDFYHAFLAGIFTGAGYMVDSNKEHGEGRSDVVVYDSVNARVAIFEAKYTKNLDKLEHECDAALEQIDDRMYAKEYEDDYDDIICFGISFFKKRCMVKRK